MLVFAIAEAYRRPPTLSDGVTKAAHRPMQRVSAAGRRVDTFCRRDALGTHVSSDPCRSFLTVGFLEDLVGGSGE